MPVLVLGDGHQDVLPQGLTFPCCALPDDTYAGGWNYLFFVPSAKVCYTETPRKNMGFVWCECTGVLGIIFDDKFMYSPTYCEAFWTCPNANVPRR